MSYSRKLCRFEGAELKKCLVEQLIGTVFPEIQARLLDNLDLRRCSSSLQHSVEIVRTHEAMKAQICHLRPQAAADIHGVDTWRYPSCSRCGRTHGQNGKEDQ